MIAPELVELMNRHFTLPANCIERQGGTIDRFEGDGQLAIRGVRELFEIIADRVCHVANAIRAAIMAEGRRQVKEDKPA